MKQKSHNSSTLQSLNISNAMQSWFVFILRQPLIRLEILSICRKNCYHIFNIFLNIRSACAASKRGMNFYANIFRTTKLSPTDICLYTKPLIHKENGISNEKKKSIAVFLFKNKHNRPLHQQNLKTIKNKPNHKKTPKP